MFSISHMIIIFVVVLIVFGPQKLPELARGLGKLMAEFRKASGDFKSAFEQEMRDMERQTMLAERKKQAEVAASSSPTEPATLATPPGAETEGLAYTADGIPAPDTGEDTRETEAALNGPVITPIPESVPRSTEKPTAALTSPEPHEPEISSSTAHDSRS